MKTKTQTQNSIQRRGMTAQCEIKLLKAARMTWIIGLVRCTKRQKTHSTVSIKDIKFTNEWKEALFLTFIFLKKPLLHSLIWRFVVLYTVYKQISFRNYRKYLKVFVNFVFIHFVSVTTCQQPSWPEHGFVSCENHEVLMGTTCTFTCQEGYQLNGQPKIKCIAEKKFDHPAPTCSGRVLFWGIHSMKSFLVNRGCKFTINFDTIYINDI